MFYRLAADEKRITDELVILKKSPDVPENGLAVRKDLADSIKNNLKHTLLNMHHDPEGINILKNFGVRKFIETTDDDYSNVYQYAQEIQLNLTTYDYMND